MYYKKESEEILQELKTSQNGLSEDEVEKRKIWKERTSEKEKGDCLAYFF